ncbi:hypothetical protein AWB78_04950 [Caballeronia calidae]|uniref:Uncharacterized protein n=1 Tax=Caballeronia calidae TaxID=1777139 RepID=A0A158DAK1_9BURK|nr:hypothetical protein AWB78_04950 [Caballeronia calidae]
MSHRPKRAILRWSEATSENEKGGDDYAVYASYRPSLGRFIGTLKVIRQADARLLYPFSGAEDIGPYASKDAAKEAAVKLGEDIVRGDLLNPEL